ncbi:hypothetical protein AB0H36_32090 [Kribbella sp. NPDC050820]|uniref:hypothetical protein n=1 Tax=Kribbella sp. NPDC050820 TaxID=3155408 RepID=UPI0033D3D293
MNGYTELFDGRTLDGWYAVPRTYDAMWPGGGYGGDALLPKVVAGVGVAAEAITSEGVTPALHPHVGSTIETEPEIRAVLDAVPASILSIGPDTGHLAWAGTSRTSTWPRRRPPGTPTRTS